MVFSSMTFLLYFLPITLAGYYLLPKVMRNYWLLIVSLFFYGWGAHDFFWVMVLSILANYTFALIIDRLPKGRWRLAVLWLCVAFNLGILFYNKYMNFTTSLLNQYVSASIPVTQIVLPLGISFFTFQAMSYVIDVYRGDTEVQKNPYYLGLYIAFFPQLVAGPIVRYRTIADQIEHRTVTLEKFCSGVTRFMAGFSQKILLSNTFSIIADEAFSVCKADPATLSVGFAWVGAIAYSLQILFDFSGYSSMAIGLGRMFGFEFLENFDYPYISKTVSEFWRRWHMSLGTFFRDYVYIPLGGSRMKSTALVIRNLFVVWLLTGIWHGANFTFLVWGLAYFVILAFERVAGLAKKSFSGIWGWLYRGFTLLCVMLGWVIFRSESLTLAWQYIRSLFALSGNPFRDNRLYRYANDYKLIFLIGFLCCTPIFKWFRETMERKYHAGEVVAFVYNMVLVSCVLLSLSSLVMGVNNPFIYFNF